MASKQKGLQLKLGAFIFVREIFWRRAFVEMPPNGPTVGAVETNCPLYITAAVAGTAAIAASLGVGCGRSDLSQPAESHARGITNSDQPQSMHTRMSGEGVMGG